MTDLRLADILRDVHLLEVARREAFALVDRDPDLSAYPELADEISALLGSDVEYLFTHARG
jgi:ATP-dependent DNA helicase RecG